MRTRAPEPGRRASTVLFDLGYGSDVGEARFIAALVCVASNGTLMPPQWDVRFTSHGQQLVRNPAWHRASARTSPDKRSQSAVASYSSARCYSRGAPEGTLAEKRHPPSERPRSISRDRTEAATDTSLVFAESWRWRPQRPTHAPGMRQATFGAGATTASGNSVTEPRLGALVPCACAASRPSSISPLDRCTPARFSPAVRCSAGAEMISNNSATAPIARWTLILSRGR